MTPPIGQQTRGGAETYILELSRLLISIRMLYYLKTVRTAALIMCTHLNA